MSTMQLSQVLANFDPPRASIRAITAQIRSEWKASEFRHRAHTAQLLQRRLIQVVK